MTLHASPERTGRFAGHLEAAARAALGVRAGRTLTDAEWAQARARLLEFVTILRAWHQKAQANDSRFGKVVSICKSKDLQ